MVKHFLWNLYNSPENPNHLLAHIIVYLPNDVKEHRLFRTKISLNQNATTVINSWEELPLPRNGWIGRIRPTNHILLKPL